MKHFECSRFVITDCWTLVLFDSKWRHKNRNIFSPIVINCCIDIKIICIIAFVLCLVDFSPRKSKKSFLSCWHVLSFICCYQTWKLRFAVSFSWLKSFFLVCKTTLYFMLWHSFLDVIMIMKAFYFLFHCFCADSDFVGLMSFSCLGFRVFCNKCKE